MLSFKLAQQSPVIGVHRAGHPSELQYTHTRTNFGQNSYNCCEKFFAYAISIAGLYKKAARTYCKKGCSSYYGDWIT